MGLGIRDWRLRADRGPRLRPDWVRSVRASERIRRLGRDWFAGRGAREALRLAAAEELAENVGAEGVIGVFLCGYEGRMPAAS